VEAKAEKKPEAKEEKKAALAQRVAFA